MPLTIWCAAGKVRYVGASNFMAWQLAHANLLAEMHSWAAFVDDPVALSYAGAGTRDGMILPYCRDFGVGVLPYFPLAGGFLTGKYQRGQQAPAGIAWRRAVPYVQALHDRCRITASNGAFGDAGPKNMGTGSANLAIAWLLSEPQVSSVIAGAHAPGASKTPMRGQPAGSLTAQEKRAADRRDPDSSHPDTGRER